MENYRFIELVNRENGFEFYQAFRDEVDWVIGGKGDTYWFAVMKDQSVKETFIGTLRDGVWTDRRVKGKGKKKTVEERPAKLVEDAHPHYHYVYGFGDKALDVSEAYGVSIGYSDLKDPEAGFHLRYLYTGEDVDAPK